MERFQLENLYEANGIEDFRLRSTEDLFKVHGIDYKAVDGYNRLDDINRAIYEKFIVNIFNGFGLDMRSTLIPLGIYYVEDITLLVKENPEDDYFNVAGGIINVIDRNGLKSVHHTWNDKEYAHLEVVKKEFKQYLRFEYKLDGRKEWLHVLEEGKEWY